MIAAVNTSTLRLPMLRRTNTWYSVCDGNWNDANTWISNGLDKKKHISPQPGDNVYINHNVICNVTITVNNLYVSGTLLFDSNPNTLTVNGDLQASGTVDQSAGANTLVLNGVNNSAVSYIPGASSTVWYSSKMAQSIMPFNYFNLILAGGPNSIKIQQADLTISGTLTFNSSLNTNNYNLSILGTTTSVNLTNSPTNTQGTIYSNSNILFVGLVTKAASQDITIIGTASVELRGGITGSIVFWNNCYVNFTTNSQSLNISINCANLTITGNITVTVLADNQVMPAGIINGTTAGSTLTNNGYVQQSSSTVPMTTGVFNYRNASNSTIAYNFNGDYALPYTTYENLIIAGTGIKSAGGNLTLNYSLTCTGRLELGNYSLSVGTTTSLKGSAGYITKSGGGSVLFGGLFNNTTGSALTAFTGNPSVEFRGGINVQSATPNFGTATLNFTTNNQTIYLGDGLNNNILIADGITLTNLSLGFTTVFGGVINGASVTSIFDNRSPCVYTNSTAPMVTGKLYCNQATNTFTYGLAGNQDITVPSDPVSPGYKNLTLNGSGAKKLLGNVSVKGTYTLTPPATLNSNGFSLTNP